MTLIYTVGFRNDWVFGITDSFSGNRDKLKLDIIDYADKDLNSIEIDKILMGELNIKSTNSLLLINKKWRIEEGMEFDLTSFRDTSLLIERNILKDLDALLKANMESTGE